MSNYYGNQASVVLIKDVCSLYGWSIYGVKEDKSDSQSDYFDPESWEGIAVKNGYILVVNNYSGGTIGGSFIRKSYDLKIIKKLKKLQALASCPSAPKGEVDNANAAIEKLKAKAEIVELIDTDIEEVIYQKNPGNSKWHIEKNGHIVAKGTGVFCFESIQYEFKYKEKNLYHYTKDEQYNYDVGFNKDIEDRNYSVPWSDMYNGNYENWKASAIEGRSEVTAKIDKLFNLVKKWNNLTVIKLGDGDSEALIKKIVSKKTVYYVAELSDKPTSYIRLAENYSSGGLPRTAVFKIIDDSYAKMVTRNWITFNDATSSLTHKKEPRVNTKSKYFGNIQSRVEKGGWNYVELVARTEITQEEVYVKVKQTNRRTIKKTPKMIEKVAEKPQFINNEKFNSIIKNGIIVNKANTKTGEKLKVLEIKRIDSKTEFREFCIYVKSLNMGYYSSYVDGIILKNNSIAAKGKK